MGKRKSRSKKNRSPNFGPLEYAVMQVIWRKTTATAEDVRHALANKHDLKDSTVRTLLRRLESKGVLEHSVQGRIFIYRSTIEPQDLAVDAVRNIADRFCKGSMSSLLLGMADDDLISAEELRDLADRIEQAESDRRQK